jgi:hypothetical protein
MEFYKNFLSNRMKSSPSRITSMLHRVVLPAMVSQKRAPDSCLGIAIFLLNLIKEQNKYN